MMDGEAFPAVTAALLLVDWGIWRCKDHKAHLWTRAKIGRFFAGQMHIFRPRTDLARVLLALAPLVGAALIAISRLEDYRHDVYDVTTGSILGMFVAYFSYRRYYPILNSSHCDTPFPSRAEWASKKGFGKLKDEEAGTGSAESFDVDDMEDAEHVPLRDTSRERGKFVGSSSEL